LAPPDDDGLDPKRQSSCPGSIQEHDHEEERFGNRESDRKGGHPFVRKGEAGYDLWYGGFSAATGGIVHTASVDGVTWSPKGWDEAHLGQFADPTRPASPATPA